eukprot:10272408-Ditylum_brightwellii.AAC.1
MAKKSGNIINGSSASGKIGAPITFAELFIISGDDKGIRIKNNTKERGTEWYMMDIVSTQLAETEKVVETVFLLLWSGIWIMTEGTRVDFDNVGSED